MRKIPELHSLDAVTRHLEQLERHGYQRLGNWSLGQVGKHLAESIEMTTEGGMSRMPRFAQRLFFSTFLRLSFLGKLGALFGLRVPTGLPQKHPVEDSVGLQEFREFAERLKAPSRQHQIDFHLWHCRHHLSFLVLAPESSVATGVDDERKLVAG